MNVKPFDAPKSRLYLHRRTTIVTHVVILPSVRAHAARDHAPEPAVSVPSAKVTSPAPTRAPEPDDEPPGTNRSSNALRAVPKGERVPTSPAANWSMLVFPTTIPPAWEGTVNHEG